MNKPIQRFFQPLIQCLFVLGICGFSNFSAAEEIKFGLPIKCDLNKDCFIQNLPDLIEGEGTADSFCQGATYDGHKGVDIRILSLKDIERNVPVIAPARGIIKAFRDGEEDVLMKTPEDKDRVKGKECGNGIVISHDKTYETQVCHLKKNSITVQKGEKVEQGDTIGFVGNSGAAQFPHVHLMIRKNGKWVDPISGQSPEKSCKTNSVKTSLFNTEVAQYFTDNTSRLMTSGITGKPIIHETLVEVGPPEALKASDQAIVGWAWFINLRKGDKIRYTLEGPQGQISQNTTKPFEKWKASYSGFSGKRTSPTKGEYRLTTELLRNGETIEQSLFVHILE